MRLGAFMQTKYLCMLAPLNRFKPPVKYSTDRSKVVLLFWMFYGVFFSVLCLLCLCARLFICALWLCASVYMCFVVTCWERAELLALVCGV